MARERRRRGRVTRARGIKFVRHRDRASFAVRRSAPRASMVRFKNRYLVVRVVANDGRALDDGREASSTKAQRSVLETLRASVRECFGDVGAGRSAQSLGVKYCDGFTGVCVVRCDRERAREVRGACATTREVGGRACAMEVRHVGGTCASAKEACVRIVRDVLEEMVQSGRVKTAELEGLVEARRRVVASSVTN